MKELRVPDSVVMALSLDDEAVRDAIGASCGVVVETDYRGAVINGDDQGLRKFVDEVTMRASSEWDLPFSIRGACGRVAKRLYRELRAAHGLEG